MHRNLGVFTTRGMPIRLFAQWQGKATGYSKGVSAASTSAARSTRWWA
jgi:TPP-dependent pyruvate/acetoin dehydrogenase alpha subunit